MSEYIIESQTLTDIADAIRTKGGTSAGLTPLEMPNAISSISTGYPTLRHLTTYTLDSDTDSNILLIPCTDEMSSCHYFIIHVNSTFSVSDWLYSGLNNTAYGYVGDRPSHDMIFTYSIIEPFQFPNGPSQSRICLCSFGPASSGKATDISQSIYNIRFNAWKATTRFLAGSTFTIYGA